MKMKKSNLYGEMIALCKPVRLSELSAEEMRSFHCGNDVIDEYFKEHAHKDAQAVTFVIRDKADGSVICCYSLSCSGFVVESHHHFTIYPAVEIKMFAMDTAYQHVPYSSHQDDGTLSDFLFGSVISRIYEFTEKECGADHIILYAVPKAENFYLKNGFSRFEEFMLQSKSRFLDGCIPMYMSL